MTSGFPGEPRKLNGALAPGTRLAGYVLEECIGRGGMAEVYRAHDEVLGRPTAVKVIAPRLASDAEFQARFLRESWAAAATESPYILPVYSAGNESGLLYLAAKYVRGGDLGTLAEKSGGTLTPALTAAVITQVASALDAAHAAGIVHRDVKPGNILVESAAQDAVQVFLADFGLAKSVLPQLREISVTGRFVGTAEYSSPEQIQGKSVEGPSDQYSLACVAFALLAGEPPFAEADTAVTKDAQLKDPPPAVSALRRELPAAVDQVLERALAKSPGERFPSCAEFAAALNDALTTDATGAAEGEPAPGERVPAGLSAWPGPPPPTAPAGRAVTYGGMLAPGRGKRPGRRRTVLIAGAAILGVLAAGGTAAALAWPGAGHRPSAAGSVPEVRSSTSVPAASPVRTAPAVRPRVRAVTPSHVATFKIPAGGTVTTGQLSQDGKLLAATDNYEVVSYGSADKIYLWNTSSRTLVKTLSSPSGVIDFSINPADDVLTAVAATGNADINGPFIIYQWDLHTGKRVKLFSSASLPYYLQVAQQYEFSGDEMTVAFADGPGIDVVEVRTGSIAHFVLPGSSSVDDLELDYDGGRLLAVGKSGTAYVWDVRTHKVIAELHTSTTPENVQTTFAFSPDGATFAAGNTPQLWDIGDQANITPAKPPWPQRGGSSWEKDVFYGGAFSPDGKVYWTPGWPPGGSQVNIWDAATGFELATTPVPYGKGGKRLSDGGYPDLVGTDGKKIEMAFLGANSGQGDTQISLWNISY